MHRHQTQVQSSSLSAPCPSCGEEEVESSQKCTHSQTNQHYCHRINECHFSTSNKYYQFTIKRGTLYVSVEFLVPYNILCFSDRGSTVLLFVGTIMRLRIKWGEYELRTEYG